MKRTTVAVFTVAVLAASLVAGDGGVASRHLTLVDYNGPPVPAGYCASEGAGIDLPGNDIGSVKDANNRSCWNHCYAKRDYCKAWVWTAYQGGTCWLKGGYGLGVIKSDVATGILHPCGPSGTHYLMLANCDLPGNDVSNRPGRSYSDCIGVAPNSFTWSDYNGGTCWFKSRAAGGVDAQNKYSGLVLA